MASPIGHTCVVSLTCSDVPYGYDDLLGMSVLHKSWTPVILKNSLIFLRNSNEERPKNIINLVQNKLLQHCLKLMNDDL